MDWTKSNLTGSQHIKPFLERHIPRMLGGSEGVVADVKNTGISVTTTDDKKVFQLNLLQTPNEMILTNLEVYMRGRGIASIALKSALAILHEGGHDRLIIHPIVNQGFAFWPHIGTLPHIDENNILIDLPAYLEKRIQKLFSGFFKNGQLSEEAFEKLQMSCYDQPIQTFRLLSQSEIVRANGLPIYKEAFSSKSPEWFQFQILMPGEASTAAILSKHVGALLPFPIPTSLSNEPPVIRQLLTEEKARLAAKQRKRTIPKSYSASSACP